MIECNQIVLHTYGTGSSRWILTPTGHGLIDQWPGDQGVIVITSPVIQEKDRTTDNCFGLIVAYGWLITSG